MNITLNGHNYELFVNHESIRKTKIMSFIIDGRAIAVYGDDNMQDCIDFLCRELFQYAKIKYHTEENDKEAEENCWIMDSDGYYYSIMYPMRYSLEIFDVDKNFWYRELIPILAEECNPEEISLIWPDYVDENIDIIMYDWDNNEENYKPLKEEKTMEYYQDFVESMFFKEFSIHNVYDMRFVKNEDNDISSYIEFKDRDIFNAIYSILQSEREN